MGGPNKHEKEKLQALMSKVRAGRDARGTNTSELSQSVIGKFGGADGLAGDIHTAFDSADTDSAKARLLGMAVDLIKVDTQLTGGQSRVEDMSDEAIEQEAMELLAKLNGIPLDHVASRQEETTAADA